MEPQPIHEMSDGCMTLVGLAGLMVTTGLTGLVVMWWGATECGTVPGTLGCGATTFLIFVPGGSMLAGLVIARLRGAHGGSVVAAGFLGVATGTIVTAVILAVGLPSDAQRQAGRDVHYERLATAPSGQR